MEGGSLSPPGPPLPPSPSLTFITSRLRRFLLVRHVQVRLVPGFRGPPTQGQVICGHLQVRTRAETGRGRPRFPHAPQVHGQGQVHLARAEAERRRCRPRPAAGSRGSAASHRLRRAGAAKVRALGRRPGDPRLTGCLGGIPPGPGSRRAWGDLAGGVGLTPAAGRAHDQGCCPRPRRRGAGARARGPGCRRRPAAGRAGCAGTTAGPWGT
jgi:hypothetical protein